MSVQTNQYAGFGYRLDYDTATKTLEDKLGEDKVEDLFDLYYDSAYDEEIKKALAQEIINVFGTDFGLKPNLIVFTHYR